MRKDKSQIRKHAERLVEQLEEEILSYRKDPAPKSASIVEQVDQMITAIDEYVEMHDLLLSKAKGKPREYKAIIDKVCESLEKRLLTQWDYDISTAFLSPWFKRVAPKGHTSKGIAKEQEDESEE